MCPILLLLLTTVVHKLLFVSIDVLAHTNTYRCILSRGRGKDMLEVLCPIVNKP